jgi:hypothetical protein
MQPFKIGTKVKLKSCDRQYTVAVVIPLDGKAYDPPWAYRMNCGAYWPHQCLVAAPHQPTPVKDAYALHLETVEANIRAKYGDRAEELIAKLQ